MSAETTQDDGAQFAAIDPTDLEAGDEVIVKDIKDGRETRGVVEDSTIEWGRAGIEVTPEDGETVMVWEETGRTFTRVEEGA